jgi:hypothetical protein
MGDEREHADVAPLEPEGPAAAPLLGMDAGALAAGGRSVADQRRLVLALQRSAGNAAAGRLLRSVAPPRVARRPDGAGHLLVAGGAADGQMPLEEFLDAVKEAACATAEEAFAGTELTAQSCPWIEHWIDYYRLRRPEQVEEAMRRYAPATAGAATAAECVPLIAGRIRIGIEEWKTTGNIPDAPADDPVGVQARLGPGRPLDASVVARMGSAFGADVSDVRIHDDARGAALSSERGSQAFAVGRHIAFAAGRYEPGTLVGDALIAHEMAHVLQQDGTQIGVAREAESDADAAAATAIGALYGDQRLRGRARPVMRSPLGIQSCHGSPRTDKMGIVDLRNPARTLLGSTGEFGLHVESQMREGGEWPMAEWKFESPSGKVHDKGSGRSDTMEFKFDEVGQWRIEARWLPTGGQNFQTFVKFVTVEDYEGAISEAFGQTAPISAHAYERFRAGLEMQAIQAGGGVVADQSSKDNDYIGLDNGDNPIRFAPPFNWKHTYRVHRVVPAGDNAPGSFRWYAVGDTGYPPNQAAYTKTTYMGNPALDLGTQSYATLQLVQPDGVTIVCEEIGEDKKVLRVLKYRQVVMNQRQADELDRVREAMKTAKEQLAAIRNGAEKGLRGSHTSLQTGRSTELALFAGPAADGNGTVLVDVTPGVKRSQYRGSSLLAAVKDFDENNQWPPGAILIEGDGLMRQRLKPRGESEKKELAGEIGWVSLGFAALGFVSLFTPFMAAAPYLFAASAATGAISGGLSIADELRNNEPDAVSIAVDVAGIAASMFGLGEASGAIAAGRGSAQGGGAVVRALTSRGEQMSLSKGVQFLRYAGFTSDVVQGVLISYKTATDIDKILADTNMSREEKVSQIVRLLAVVAMQGGLMAYGARDLRRARTRLDKVLDNHALSKRLTADTLDHLGALDDAALKHLHGLDAQELENVARVSGSNKGGARELSKAHGEDFVNLAKTGRYNNLDELAEELGRRKAGVHPDAPHGAPEPVGDAHLPDRPVRTEHGEVGPTGRPADSIAVELQLAPNAHGEPHVFHMTEDGRLFRCSDVCTEIVASFDSRVRQVRERSISTQRGVEWQTTMRTEGMEISKRARWLRDRVKQLAEDHAAKLRNIGRAKAASRKEALEAKRVEWLANERRVIEEHAQSLENRMSELERKLGGYGRPMGTPIPGVAPPGPPTVAGLRERYPDIVNAESGLSDELQSIERASVDPANAIDVERRLAALQQRFAQAANDRVPAMIAQGRQMQAAAGVGLARVGGGDHCIAHVGGVRTASGAGVVPGFEQRTREVIERGRQIGHAFAPDNFDEGMAAVLNRNRGTAQAVQPSGVVRASHAEKQASRARPGEPIGVSLPMCYDCFDYFRREAVAGGRPLVVADPDMVRVFHPDGRVTSPKYSAPTANGPAQP